MTEQFEETFTEEGIPEQEPLEAEPVKKPGRVSRAFSRVGDIIVSSPRVATQTSRKFALKSGTRIGRGVAGFEQKVSGREEEEEIEKFTPLTAQEIETLAQQMLSQGLFSTIEEARVYIRNQQVVESIKSTRPKPKPHLKPKPPREGKITRLPGAVEKGTGFFTDVGKVPRIPVAQEPMEEGILDDIGEELVFEPWGEPVEQGDLGGEGILTSPVQSPTDSWGFGTMEGFLGGFMGLGLGAEEVYPVQELNIGVPGGLEIVGVIQDAQGRTGYRIIWQEEELNWFPAGKE